jgi:hypothetical protein
VTNLLARFLVPHAHNDHHPHSIRPLALTLYLTIILVCQLVYNFTRTGEVRILSYATNINQSAIITLTNKERQSSGATILKESSILDQVAAKKAADMFAGNYWAHVSPSGITPWYWYDQVGYKYIYAGENLARDFDTSDNVMQGWMNSPGHRENLLSANYTEIGVAVVNGNLLGHETTLVIQEFGKPQVLANSSKTSTPTPAPTPIGVPVTSELKPATSPNSVPRPVTANPYIASPQSEVDATVGPAVLSIQNLGVGQILLLVILLPLVAFFGFDALELIRRRQVVLRGHSLTHAAVLGLVLVVVVTASFGVLR